MSEPEAAPKLDVREGISFLCPECGEEISVRDVWSFILAAHLSSGCPAMHGLLHE